MTSKWLPVLAAAGGVLLAAGCGSTPARPVSSGGPAVAVIGAPTLATSVSSASGTSWAIIPMGDSATSLNNFWELFARAAGGTSWQLVTPPGVASNGGLVMTATGASSLVTGFRPSQDLTFSPLAATADAGAKWSQPTLLSPGLGNAPAALAAGPGDQLIALTDDGDVKTSTSRGVTWSTLTTQQSLARSAAGRACGLAAVTAVAWTPAGSPLVAGRCDRAGHAGIVTHSASAWRLTGPALPAALSHDAVDVMSLATTGDKTIAVLAAASATGTSVLVAWSADGGAHWRLSPALPAGRGTPPSVSIWADASAGLILPSPGSTAASPRTGAVIGWEAASWHMLPPLPAGTRTLATGPGGQPQALAASGATMTVWQLATNAPQWAPAQTVQVAIPYGSSG